MCSSLNPKNLLQQQNRIEESKTPSNSPVKSFSLHIPANLPSYPEASKLVSTKLINFASIKTCSNSIISSSSCSSIFTMLSSKTEILKQKDSFIPTGKIKYFAARNTVTKDHSKNSVKIITNIAKPKTFQVGQWPPSSFFGLYSGHFGNSCVSFLQKNLHNFILNDQFFPLEPKKAIINGFAKADSTFIQQAEETCNLSGAFAVVVLVVGKKCFVANVGESKAIVSMRNGTKIIELSQRHCPEDDEEATRVTLSGGKVYKDFIINEIGEKEEIGALKIVPGKRNFTRSFGDFDCKLKQYGGIPVTIISEPHIKSFTISESCDFICLTSENINFEFDNSYIVESLYRPLPFNSHPISTRVDLLIQELIEKCKGNTTLILIGLKQINYE